MLIPEILSHRYVIWETPLFLKIDIIIAQETLQLVQELWDEIYRGEKLVLSVSVVSFKATELDDILETQNYDLNVINTWEQNNVFLPVLCQSYFGLWGYNMNN